jgi:hypothetical protein
MDYLPRQPAIKLTTAFTIFSMVGFVLSSAVWMPVVFVGLLVASVPLATFLITLVVYRLFYKKINVVEETWLYWCLILSGVVAIGELTNIFTYK